MIVYASATDLTSGSVPWLLSTPSNAATLLRWASILVARATNRDLLTEPTGTDVQTLTDATCAQVASWVALGVDPAKAGTDFPAPVKRSTILDGNVERDTTAQAKAVGEAANGLCDLATAILQQGGLLWVPLPVVGDPDCLPTWGLDVPWWSYGVPFSGDRGDSIDWAAAVDAELNRLLE